MENREGRKSKQLVHPRDRRKKKVMQVKRENSNKPWYLHLEKSEITFFFDLIEEDLTSRFKRKISSTTLGNADGSLDEEHDNAFKRVAVKWEQPEDDEVCTDVGDNVSVDAEMCTETEEKNQGRGEDNSEGFLNVEGENEGRAGLRDDQPFEGELHGDLRREMTAKNVQSRRVQKWSEEIELSNYVYRKGSFEDTMRCTQNKMPYNLLLYLNTFLGDLACNKDTMARWLEEFNKKRFNNRNNKGMRNNFKADLYRVVIHDGGIISFKLITSRNEIGKTTYYMNEELLHLEINNILEKYYPLKYIFYLNQKVRDFQKLVIPLELKSDKPITCGILLDFDYMGHSFEMIKKRPMKLVDLMVILDKICELLREKCTVIYVHYARRSIPQGEANSAGAANELILSHPRRAPKNTANAYRGHACRHERSYSYLFDDLQSTLELFEERNIKMVIRTSEFTEEVEMTSSAADTMLSSRSFRPSPPTCLPPTSHPSAIADASQKKKKKTIVKSIAQLFENPYVDNVLLLCNDIDVISYCYHVRHKVKYKNGEVSMKKEYAFRFMKPVLIFCFLNNLPVKNGKIYPHLKLDRFCYMSFIIRTYLLRCQANKLQRLATEIHFNVDLVQELIKKYNMENSTLKKTMNILLLDDLLYKMKGKTKKKAHAEIPLSELMRRSFSAVYYPMQYYLQDS
ncbi:gametocyte development protein 1, putative [Plasmodium knowlesi strain H]|uniref:Gametocyte development protein 1, putative n=3 Tax=Plasmodium knowlesi TaxID=5850 RepID=A0A5K1VSD0_PLAKH|nr:gametocyte development protein 1, putative [Plasmodium knowlesi strain H]OTN67503.1 putative Cytoadherence-linked protein [Plasmodium knowlesi]CAA9987632.1 gametocyte development protein 1, putative [Plasmodium knowlesi strain H]SBO26966.1 gametocyte development protein 1, putative [Plasmodium knowlesi strain H]SBO29269.1 gametocyte development protein 1, putative [Plasmodium knowlesi strain H]VVS77106.1 gametocyte development protein 1, putative [Plasmodium knowlesi strain H]|eukprot:XP_002258631.1 Cytoadherence-linked protein, putative [Plasmodium knowlesi strain H]